MNHANEINLLAPFEIWEVPLEDQVVKFKKPLSLTPEILSPESSTDRIYLTIDVPELNISVHADNRADLLEFVYSDIRFVWRHIVLAPENSLSREAVKIKGNWLNVAEVVHG